MCAYVQIYLDTLMFDEKYRRIISPNFKLLFSTKNTLITDVKTGNLQY